MPELAAIADALGETGSLPAVLATLVRVEGSSYRRPGARLLLTADGRRIGAISGGCLEADLVERARGVRARGVGFNINSQIHPGGWLRRRAARLVDRFRWSP